MKVTSRFIVVGLVAGTAASSMLGFGRYAQPPVKNPEFTTSMAASFGGEKHVTRASKDATLSFTFPAEVSEILVVGGQKVRKGELLIKARDEDVRYQMELAKLISETDLEVQKAKVGVDLAQVEFEAQEVARKKDGTNKMEHRRAEATLAARKVELAIAEHERKQQAMQLQIRQAQLDRLSILAPFDGRIDEVGVDVGQVKKDSEPVLRIVKTDPLWIDVPTPTGQTITLGLKPGDKAWVLLDMPGEPKVWLAKVIEVGAAADPASNTRRIRVELANPNDWPSGMTAWVRFTAPQGEWTTRVVEPQKQAAAKDGELKTSERSH